VAHLRYLGMTITNQNLIEEEIKRRFNLDNAFYHSVQKLPSSRMLSKIIKIKIYKSIILSVILCGCKTWSLSLREEYRLRVFENRVLRRILGLKRDEMMGGWRKLRNEELHNLNSSPSIIRMIKSRLMSWEGHVARMGEKRKAYRIVVGNPEGKRPLGRPRRIFFIWWGGT
jgi:hypothetical protein